MKHLRIRRLAVLTCIGLVAATVSGCDAGTNSPPATGAGATTTETTTTVDNNRPEASKFYRHFRIGTALPVEYYETLAAGVSAANVVLVGEVRRLKVSRFVQGEAAADRFAMIGMVLRPVEVIAGDLPQRFATDLTVEFLGRTVTDRSGDTIEEVAPELLAILPVGHQGLWALRSKADPTIPGKPGVVRLDPAEADYWRVVSPQGLFIQGANGVETPLAEDLGADMAAEGRRYRQMSDLVRYVKRLQ